MEYKISDLITDISMGPFGSKVHRSNYVQEGVPYLNGGNLTGYKINEQEFNYLTEEKADELGRAVAHRGDILVTHRGTLGQIAYIPENSKYKRYVTGNSQFRFTCNDKIMAKYLVYYFHSPIGQSKLLSNASQVGVPALAQPTTSFQKLVIDIPSIDYQKRVIAFIDAIQEKIENNVAINKNLLQQAQSIFVHMFANNDSVIPATVADVALNVTDGVHNTVHDDPEGQYLLLSCKNIKGGSLSIGSSERRINAETFEKLRRRTKLSNG